MIVKYTFNQVGYLKDPKNAVEELNAALKYMNKDDFLFCLYNIAIAQGVAHIAQKTSISREGIYHMLSPGTGNPQLKVLLSILDAMGFELQVATKSTDSQTRRTHSEPRNNSLQQLMPDLASLWHPDSNGDLTPNDITPNSRKRIWWRCSNQSHSWETTISSLVVTLKKDFLKNDPFTTEALAERLKKICPICAKQ